MYSARFIDKSVLGPYLLRRDMFELITEKEVAILW